MEEMDSIDEKIISEIKKRLGGNPSEKEMLKYLNEMTPRDIMKMLLNIEENLTDDEREKIAVTKVPGDDGYDDADFGYDDSEDDFSTGKLECMPVCELKKYTLRIKLRGISPSIWRKIEVPSSVKLTSLAEIIITAMGWWNEHLHQFVGKGRNQLYTTAQKPDDDCFFGDRRVWGGDVPISHLLKKEKDKVLFEYDFGDGWEHDVVLSKVDDYADGEKRVVRLVGGKRACPPEDCGGVWGYNELCEAMQHPYSARAKELKSWLGYKYDPEEFFLDEVQDEIDSFNN